MHKIFFTALFAIMAFTASAAQDTPADSIATDGPKVVIAGNSIAEIWPGSSPQFFADSKWVSTGISGETSRQILARFNRDVMSQNPDVVIILTPLTNDIAQNEGPVSFEYMISNVRKMIERAKDGGIRVILTSNAPCAYFFWAPWISPAQDIVKTNRLLQKLAEELNVEYVDIYTPLASPDGSFPEIYSYDGCHPTPAGYSVIESILFPLINNTK